MGFELALRGTRRGSPRRRRNPFTGKPDVQTPLVMSDAELLAALSVVSRRGGTLDDDGGGLVALPKAKIQFSGFDAEGDIVKVIGDLASACEFLFELATAGQLAIEIPSAEEGAATLVTTAEALARAQALDDELGSTVLVGDREELVSVLEPHYASAMAYAARVT